MSRILRIYVALVLVLAALAIWGAAHLEIGAPELSGRAVLFWFLLTLAAEAFWFETPSARGMVSMSSAISLATLFILPPFLCLGIVAGAVLISDRLLHRRPLVRSAFNAGQTVISLSAAALVFRGFAGFEAPPGSAAILHHPLAVWASPLAFYLVNTFLVSIAVGLHARGSVLRAWSENYGNSWFFLASSVLFVLAVSLVCCVEALGLWSAALVILLLGLVKEGTMRLALD